MVKRYALVAGIDVFYIFSMNTDNPVASKWIAALESGVKLIKVNNYAQIRPGYLFKDNNFYSPDDIDMTNPLPEIHTEVEKNQYAGIINNDVVGLFTMAKEDVTTEIYEMVDAGIQSDPAIINLQEYDNGLYVNIGWTFEDNKFSPPAGV